MDKTYKCTYSRALRTFKQTSEQNVEKIINDQQTQTIYNNLKYPARMLMLLFFLLLLFFSLANCKLQLLRALANH